MNSCTYTDQLDAYLDGELAPDAARAVEEHVAECTACVEELALAQRVQEGLQAMPEEHCPDDVFAAALERIEREKVDMPGSVESHPTPRRKRPQTSRDRTARRGSRTLRLHHWRVAGSIAAVLAVVVMGIFLIRSGIETRADIPLQADVHPPSEEGRTAVPVDSSAGSTPGSPSTFSGPQPEAPSVDTVPDEQVAGAHQEAQHDFHESEADVAREEARLALSLVAEAGRRGTEAARENVNDSFQHVSEALAVAFSK